MIEKSGAVAIATEHLRVNGIDVEGFAEARFLPEEQIWSCCFFNKMPNAGVDCPGMTIVDVDCETGRASLFDSM
jgi:hypothetical protein